MLLTTLLGLSFIGVCGLMFINDSTNNKICSSNELKNIKGDGIKCSKNVQISVNQSNEHVLMIAPSGVGKSRNFMMPNINGLDNCTIICTDPSGEIEKTCQTNKKTYIFNPFSKNSVGYNPLENCKNEFEVRKLAKIILKNGSVSTDKSNGNQQEWIEMATPLLTAYMLYNYHTKSYKFNDMIQSLCTSPIMAKKQVSILDEIMGSDIDSAKLELMSFLQVMNAQQTLSSIRAVLNSCLQVFFDENLDNVFSKPNLDLNKLRKEESILYIQIPERHAEYYSPLTATLMTQLFDSLIDNDGLQVYMLFDEFTNIGYIDSMTKILSTCRKRRISIVAAIQSIIQLKRVYGEIDGTEIQELFKTILVGNGLKDSAEYISNILGIVTVGEKTKTTKQLMTADEIRRLNKDEMLIICNNKRPVLDKMLEMVV